MGRLRYPCGPATTISAMTLAALSGCGGGASLISADGSDGSSDVLDEADASPPDDSDGETFALPPVCGDGNVDPGEECDDGNRMNDDGCDWRCRVGDGTFEYPPPESGASEVTPVAPPLAVVPDAEFTETDGRARLAWGSGAFGCFCKSGANARDQQYLSQS